jgi:hypothetical protein
MDNSASGSSEDRGKRAPKRLRSGGTRVVYPRGVEERYGISAPTRWRWERDRLLPARDVFMGGKPIGWRPETLEAADRGQAS